MMDVKRTTVLAGMSQQTDGLDFARKIQSFCQSSHADLSLVHVMEENWLFPALYGQTLGSFDIADLCQEPARLEQSEMHRRLESVQAAVAKDRPIRIKILEAQNPVDALIAEARVTDASMIAVEAQKHLYEVIPQGMSVPLGLLQKSPYPVLILRKGTPNRFEHEQKVIVVADALTMDSLHAVQEAMRLAALWGHTKVVHLHVVAERIPDLLQKMQRSTPHAQEISELFHKQLEVTLQKRSWELQAPLVNSGGRYETAICVGSVPEQLRRYLDLHQPDLLVLGRSPGVHPIGRVLFASLLRDSEALLMVP